MSNDCSNTIEIIGNKEVITRLFERVKSEERDWGVDPDPNKTEEENRIMMGLEFDFNKVIPYPQEFKVLDDAYENAKAAGVPWRELPKSAYENGGWMWCINHWGTSDNATNTLARFIDQEKIHEVENFKLSNYENPACAEIYYTTVNSPALPVTQALSEQYPELTFKHAYEEEGLMGKGYQVWKAGELIAEEEPRDEWDDDEDFEDGDGDFDEDDDEDEDEEEDVEEDMDSDDAGVEISHTTGISGESSSNTYDDSMWNIKKLEDGSLEILEYLGKDSSPVFPEGVSIIGSDAFKKNTNLLSVVIPDGVKHIGWDAFNGCSNLLSVIIPEGVKEISPGAFYKCSSLLSVVIPESVMFIEEIAFKGCSSLKSIVIPGHVFGVDGNAFQGCRGLSTLELGDGLKYIDDEAFKDCIKLKSIVIPGSVRIGALAFEGCKGLTSVVISDGVEEIPFDVFMGCTSLQSVVFPRSVNRIDKDVFNDSPDLVIYAPKDSYAIEYAKKQGISYIEE